MKNFIKKYFFHIVIFSFSFFIFFYHLDYTTLVSFDEAWYGAIAKNIIKNNDWLNLEFNGKPYYDHPPMGFWLMALSYKIFGISEFSTRFPSSFLGVLTILLLFLTAEKLFKNRFLSFCSSLLMLTSVWYVLRVRSGNLDGFLVFFYVLTVYLILKTKERFIFFPLLTLSFAGLMLTKTLVGLPVLILILFFLWQEILNFKKNWRFLTLGLLSFSILFFPWYLSQWQKYSDFYQYHFLTIGARNKDLWSFFKLINIDKSFFYLHMGIRKWYYPWLLSSLFLLLTFKAFVKKEVFFVFLWLFLVLYPFLTSERTELWHLIPVYLPIALITPLGIYSLIFFLLKMIISGKKVAGKIANFLVLLSFLFLSFIQFKIYYYEVFPQSRFIPDDVDISKKLAKYSKRIFLDDDFFPVAVFYSGKEIQPLFTLSDDKKTLVKLFLSDEKDFVIVTRNWALNNLKENNLSYKLLEKNNSYSIIEKL